MTDETQAPQDGALEVQQQPAGDATTERLVTHHDADARGPVAGRPMSRCRGTTKSGRPCSNGAGPAGYCIAHAKDPQTLATLQAARSAGGRAPRVNVQVGLTPAVADAIDLKDSASQLAILTATTRALAMGRVSSNTAQAIAVLVKTAAAINAADQSEAIKALEARLESTKRRRPSTALEQLHERLDRVTGDGTCVALILPLIGLGMRCTRPCARCRALAAEVERLRPE